MHAYMSFFVVEISHSLNPGSTQLWIEERSLLLS